MAFITFQCLSCSKGRAWCITLGSRLSGCLGQLQHFWQPTLGESVRRAEVFHVRGAGFTTSASTQGRCSAAWSWAQGLPGARQEGAVCSWEPLHLCQSLRKMVRNAVVLQSFSILLFLIETESSCLLFVLFFFNKEEMLAPWKHACSNDCPFSVTYPGVVWALCRQRRKRRRK